MDTLIGHFADLKDPRQEGKIRYPLTDILVIAACAATCGAETYEDIVLYGESIYGESKRDWLASFLDLEHGIPSHDTFRRVFSLRVFSLRVFSLRVFSLRVFSLRVFSLRVFSLRVFSLRVFSLIDADAFGACFAAWAASRTTSLEGEVVAIDGKTVRRSFDTKRDRYQAGAVAVARGERLGSRAVCRVSSTAVDADSNEITAIPDVLDVRELEGTLVTLDAMGTQKDIARQIRDRKGDYLLVLKGNHGEAYEAVASYFDTYCFGRGALPAYLRRVRRKPWPLRAAPGLRLRTGGPACPPQRVARSAVRLSRGEYSIRQWQTGRDGADSLLPV